MKTAAMCGCFCLCVKHSIRHKKSRVVIDAAFALKRYRNYFASVPPRFFLKNDSIMPNTWRWLVRPEMPCLAPG